MKALFVISSFENGAWLSEITHPYWHLIERDVEVDFASPKGGKVGWSPYSDPYAEGTTEPHDLVSKGFLSDPSLMARLATTLALQDVELDQYDAVHVAGGQGATFDLYPNKDLAKVLEHFWMREKIVAAICHGAIALGNIPELIRAGASRGIRLPAIANWSVSSARVSFRVIRRRCSKKRERAIRRRAPMRRALSSTVNC